MTANVTTTTNFHVRPILGGHELTPEELDRLDYVDWAAVANGEESWSGFRYRGEIYDLAEFEPATGTLASDWHAWQTQSYFDAIAVRFVDDVPYWSEAGVIVAHLTW